MAALFRMLEHALDHIDGKPIDNSQYTFDPLNPAQNRDPRFNNTVIYDGHQGEHVRPVDHAPYRDGTRRTAASQASSGVKKV